MWFSHLLVGAVAVLSLSAHAQQGWSPSDEAAPRVPMPMVQQRPIAQTPLGERAGSFARHDAVRLSDIVHGDLRTAKLVHGVVMNNDPKPRPVLLQVDGFSRPVAAMAVLHENGRVHVVSPAMGNAYAVSIEDRFEGVMASCFEPRDEQSCWRIGLAPDTAMTMVFPTGFNRSRR